MSRVAPHAGVPLDEGRRHLRILMVDDDAFMLSILCLTLRAIGQNDLLTVGGGSAALAMIESTPQRFDLIICDVDMPGMDGIDFLSGLSALKFNGSIILLSGTGLRVLHSVRALLHASRLVVLGVLEKPAGRSELNALITQWRTRPQQASAPGSHPTISAGEIRDAAANDQFVLHYQPKVSLHTAAVVGAEALVRWNHPRHGFLRPDRFVPVAEAEGVIDSITEWVLRHAMQQLARWQLAGFDLALSVNVSMSDLHSRELLRQLTAMCSSTGSAPQNLVLEITESQVCASSIPLENLIRLRLHRYRLSIDDFGTGYSSLAQLRDVPFSELKVDRGFVQGARNNQIIRPILEGSIGIGKGLGMEVVAEGVETEDDWHLLRELGCDVAQGYFVSTPLADADVLPWVRKWSETRQARLAPP